MREMCIVPAGRGRCCDQTKSLSPSDSEREWTLLILKMTWKVMLPSILWWLIKQRDATGSGGPPEEGTWGTPK